MKLDQLLSSADPVPAPRSDALRAAVLAELKQPPARGWRADAVILIAICALLPIAVASAMFALGALQPAHLVDRALPIVSLIAIGACSAFAAIAPRRRGLRLSGFLLSAVGVVGLVLARRSTGLGTAPEWVCTASHLAVGLAPLGFAISLLRKSAIDPFRSALLGLSVGTVGAVVGELACERGWTHVAIWHLSAWLGLAILAVAISRFLRPTSFAP